MSEYKVNLEIYSFILNGYPKDDSKKFYTSSLKSISLDDCGYISDEDTPYTKKTINDKLRRSCDFIDGTIKKDTGLTKSELKIEDKDNSMSFNLDGITSNDLIKFSHIFNTKETIVLDNKIKKIQDNIPNMEKLFDKIKVQKVLTDVENILKPEWGIKNQYDETYIKILRPKKEDEYVVIGDIHGSFATFVRILLRLRKMNFFDANCKFGKNKHLIFLGDIVDRGIYGFEIIMLIFMLKKLNQNNVHINNGNHEEKNTNSVYGLENEMNKLFGETSTDTNSLWNKLNNIFLYNHSALLIQNPNEKDKYTYLAHGGYPIKTDGSGLHAMFTAEYIKSNDKIFINNNEISYNNCNNIRWSDFYGKATTIENTTRKCSWIAGTNLIEEIKKIGIELTIRAHQDNNYNTKLIKMGSDYGIFTDINQVARPGLIDPYICYGFTDLITVDNDKLKINDTTLDFITVVTISTNTDYNRNLDRDSFTILKFIKNNIPTQKCVNIGSSEETQIKEEIKKLKLPVVSEPVIVSTAAPATKSTPVPTAAPTPVPSVSSKTTISKKFIYEPKIQSKIKIMDDINKRNEYYEYKYGIPYELNDFFDVNFYLNMDNYSPIIIEELNYPQETFESQPFLEIQMPISYNYNEPQFNFSSEKLLKKYLKYKEKYLKLKNKV